MQTRAFYKRGYKPLIFALLALSLIGSAENHAAASPVAQEQEDPPEEVELENGYVISFLGVEYDESEDASTWSYHVQEMETAQDLSNWVLELPFCVEVLDADPEPWETVHPDPNAQLSGIKWETGDGFEAGDFWVSLAGEWAVGETQVAAKGPDMAFGTIAGPSCEQNRAPVAVDDAVSTYVNREIAIPVMSNDYDPDGDIIFLDAFDGTSQEGGTVELADMGTPGDASDDYLVYTPPAGFLGTDSFTYTVGDGSLATQGTVSIMVLESGVAPIANPDAYIFRQPPFTIPAPGLLLNDQLLDYDTVVIVLEVEPEYGSVEIEEDGGFTYTPGDDFTCEDSFSYSLSAGEETSELATVTLLVLDEEKPTAEWTRPVPKGGKLIIKQDEVVELEVEARDNRAIDRVEFFRWDAATREYFNIAEVKIAPYAAEVQAAELQQGYNQIYAAVYDTAENRSDVEHIYLYKEESFLIYLPSTLK
jgi:hypothetical protein